MGKSIIANVKPISFQMTELHKVSRSTTKDGSRATHVGTAGDMFDGPGGPLGSFSRNGFSSPTVLLVVIVYVCGGWWVVCERALYLGTTYATRLGWAVPQRDPEHGRRVE
jgi:hypothetical protein